MWGGASRVIVVTGLVACGRPALPHLSARARIVPAAPSPPATCEDGHYGGIEPAPPRRLTNIEQRMRWGFRLPNGEPDLVACRAICRRALAPGDDVIDCFHAKADVTIGCETPACAERYDKRVARSMFCGADGERASANPAAAQAAIPFMFAQGDEVVVCDLR